MDMVEFREGNHLKPLTLKSKENYLRDLWNIEHSLTGRLDAQIAYTFAMEPSYLLINSMVLFEKGYFDCAFYSIRQALKISTTMMYLVDADSNVRRAELAKWKTEKKIPMYG